MTNNPRFQINKWLNLGIVVESVVSGGTELIVSAPINQLTHWAPQNTIPSEWKNPDGTINPWIFH